MGLWFSVPNYTTLNNYNYLSVWSIYRIKLSQCIYKWLIRIYSIKGISKTLFSVISIHAQFPILNTYFCIWKQKQLQILYVYFWTPFEMYSSAEAAERGHYKNLSQEKRQAEQWWPVLKEKKVLGRWRKYVIWIYIYMKQTRPQNIFFWADFKLIYSFLHLYF